MLPMDSLSVLINQSRDEMWNQIQIFPRFPWFAWMLVLGLPCDRFIAPILVTSDRSSLSQEIQINPFRCKEIIN